jgi:GTP-binding protein
VEPAIVALVGRPNVGKSTLFNRLVGESIAVVEDLPGTTRDRIYGDVEWSGHEFTLIDTGGIEGDPDTDLARLIRAQATIAVEEADLIVFCVDAREGLTSDDQAVADLLRRSGKPVAIAATKADNAARRLDANELYRLGYDEVIPVSALHGTGTGDLLDWIVARLAPEPPAPEDGDDHPRIAIVGRPNVGKSSLLNAVLGYERSIVFDRPGTTRDAIDTEIVHKEQPLTLIDTAGIRRRGKIEFGVEKYSVIRALRAIDRADVVLIVIDAEEGVTAQDTHLAGYVRQAGRAAVLVLNKWDTVPRDHDAAKRFDARVREDFKFMPWAPFVHVSAKTGSRVTRPLDLALEAYRERQRRISTGELNRVVREALAAHAPPSRRGRALRIYYATQAEIEPPTFVFFVNDDDLIHVTYERFLENQLRQAFGFEGTPIRLRFRGREPRDEERGSE